MEVNREIPVLKPGLQIAKPGDPQPELDDPTRKLYEETLPSVVQIRTNSGTGSGWFMDKEGRIGTAAHVVMGSSEHYAITADGTRYKLEIEKMDDLNDTAIMKPVQFKEGSRPTLELRPASELKPDDKVFGMGHPQGLRPAYISPGYHRLQQSQFEMMKGLAEGVEEQVNAKVSTLTPKEKPLVEGFLNRDITNARIHIRPGDSGGPLLDENKKVVGINDMITSFENGYFIPSEKVNALYNDPGKFNFKYNWVASPLAQEYKHAWKSDPVLAIAETAGVGTAGVFGNAVLNKLPRVGGSGIGAVGGMLLYNDANKLLNSTDTRDQVKFGIASLGDLAAVGGAIASFVPRAQFAAKIAIGLGVAGRIGSEFVENRRVLSDISQKDGSFMPPLSPDIHKSLGLGTDKTRGK